MARKYAHLYRKICDRAFHLYLRDVDSLRSLYGRLEIDVSRMLIARMKRDKLVDAICAQEFGVDEYIEYKAQCLEWDRCRDFVEGKVVNI